MEKPKVAFLGPVASYTHQAALENFPESQYLLCPHASIAAVFHAVQSGACHRGVVPFENSSNGIVVMTLDLFADRKKELRDVLVCGEAYVDVHHCLVGRSPRRTAGQSPPQPSAAQGDRHAAFRDVAPRIKKLYSHPQVWGQCEDFLEEYLPDVERQDVSSTSKAADIVAQENAAPRLGSVDDEASINAAISSATAAQIYGLDILAHGIQDVGANMTRFFILCKRESADSQAVARNQSIDATAGVLITGPLSATSSGLCGVFGSGGGSNNAFASPSFKTLISFVVPHTSPGALAKGLAVFGENGLNLLSINSRPSLIEPWNYVFFLEIAGRRERAGRGVVNAALRDLCGVAAGGEGAGWRWLGSWEMQTDIA